MSTFYLITRESYTCPLRFKYHLTFHDSYRYYPIPKRQFNAICTLCMPLADKCDLNHSLARSKSSFNFLQIKNVLIFCICFRPTLQLRRLCKLFQKHPNFLVTLDLNWVSGLPPQVPRNQSITRTLTRWKSCMFKGGRIVPSSSNQKGLLQKEVT